MPIRHDGAALERVPKRHRACALALTAFAQESDGCNSKPHKGQRFWNGLLGADHVRSKGHVLTGTLIGAALGLLGGELQKNPQKSRDVTLDKDMKFGVRLTEDMYVNRMSKSKS